MHPAWAGYWVCFDESADDVHTLGTGFLPLVQNSCQALDPIFHQDLLFSRTKADPHLPAFSFRTKTQLKFVTYKSFTAKLKFLFSKAGFSPERFTGHSLRRGGASSIPVGPAFSRFRLVEIGNLLYGQDI